MLLSTFQLEALTQQNSQLTAALKKMFINFNLSDFETSANASGQLAQSNSQEVRLARFDELRKKYTKGLTSPKKKAIASFNLRAAREAIENI